jgi:FolB domain-containing protein
MDTVFIKNLLVRGIIGVNDWERREAQDILINIEVRTDTGPAARADDVEQSVNYRTLAKKIQVHAATAARFTVEALAEDIAGLCLDEAGAAAVLVRVEKPGAVRFAESVGVEIERRRHG